MDGTYSRANTNGLCDICPHNCPIPEGEVGYCGVRRNTGGRIVPTNYGVVSSIAVDPIEKKPLKKFHPGRPILSIGGFGCNLRCPFCQNHELLLVKNLGKSSLEARNPRATDTPHKNSFSYNTGKVAVPKGRNAAIYTPDEVVQLALGIKNNLGIAYTYNEPLINYEFVMDTAKKIRESGLKNVLVTNGFINPEPLQKLIPHIDAANIDLKAFSNEFYKNLGGRLEPVLATIESAHKHWHMEVTSLIIPGENEDIEPLAMWLGGIDREIPLHITRFFPRHKYSGLSPTLVETIQKQVDVARKYLKYVFAGNV